MTLVEASFNHQLSELRDRVEALEGHQRVGAGRPVQAGKAASEVSIQDGDAVSVSLRELGRRVASLEERNTPRRN